MLIQKKRIRSLTANLPTVAEGTNLVFAVKGLTNHAQRIEQAGFRQPLQSGSVVLPTARGPVTRYNAEGKFLIHRDQPKETVYRQRDWTHLEWHGPDQVEVTKVVEIPYQRYPRTFVPPPSIEFRLATTTDGEMIIVSDQIAYTPDNTERCLHTANVFLEYFGECHVLDENLDSIIRVDVRRLNWDVLPPGVYPWSRMQELITERSPVLANARHNVLRNNLAYINEFGPSFTAVGRAGFSGYVVFGFPEKNEFVCESINLNNATYFFGENWENLSQLSKAQILNHNLHRHRVIHMPGWHNQVSSILH